MAAPSIDFQKVREHRGRKDKGFEELVRQLVLADLPQGWKSYECRGEGSDGGVEILVHMDDGSSCGWQAKYFITAFGDKQIDQLKESFSTALTNFGAPAAANMKRYVVAVPQNIQGPGTAQSDDARKRWNRFVAWAEKESFTVIKRTITPELWDETALIQRLTRSGNPYPGILAYWFDATVLTADWLREHVRRAIDTLNIGYDGDEHVDVEALKVFDVLLRRGSVVADLRRDFTEVRRLPVVPESLTGLVGLPVSAAGALSVLQEAIGRFLKLEEALDHPFDEPWPVQAWRDAWRAVVNTVLGFIDYAEEQTQDVDPAAVRRQLWERFDLPAMRREVFGSPWHRSLAADGTRAVLLVGAAGNGKSHLLAHAAKTAAAEGIPVLFLSGRQFGEGDPGGTILNLLDLRGRSLAEALGALDAAATANGSRALILIDALNEGAGLRVWPQHLAGLLDEVRRHPQLVLVVSCRQEYLDATVPTPVQARFHQVRVDGFSYEEQERALKIYMDRHGIARPAGPALDPEFSNPFFLRLVCKALKDASPPRVIPRGLRGVGQVFRFVFETRGRHLGVPGRDGTAQLVAPLQKALQALAGDMAGNRRDYVPLDRAAAIVNQAFGPYPAPAGSTWLDVLAGNGFVRRDILPGQEDDGFSAPEEGIRFTFQRLCDHLMAQALMEEVTSIETAFAPGGPLAFILEMERFLGRTHLSVRGLWFGLTGALWIAIAERHGRELIDLVSGTLSDEQRERTRFMNFRQPFIESVRWRANAAFSDATRRIAEWFFDDEVGEQIALRLELALILGHPWNAASLHETLAGLTLADRDKWWSAAFLRTSTNSVSDANRTIEWCLGPDIGQADTIVLELAALLLPWFFTTSNRPLRDRATKGLVNLFLARPALVADTLRRFGGIGDDYLRERVFAAAYGAALHIRGDREVLAAGAQAAWDVVFSTAPVTRHAMLREYARGLVEVAQARGALPPDIEPSRCRPPYASNPIETWPGKDDIAALADAHRPDSIVWSVLGRIDAGDEPHLAGDFGRYIVEPVAERFSVHPRTENGTEGGCFPAIRAQRWIVARALELGWTVKRFGDSEGRLPHPLSRTTHEVERIGKKYQWIAFHELCGHLADHHWQDGNSFRYGLSADGKRGILAEMGDLLRHDIDPSVLVTAEAAPASNGPVVSLPETDFSLAGSVEEALVWTRGFDGVPTPEALIEYRDREGRRWWIVEAFRRDRDYMEKQRLAGPIRTMQSSIDMIILRREDRPRLLAALRGCNAYANGAFWRDHSFDGFVGQVAWDSGRARLVPGPVLDSELLGIPYLLPVMAGSPKASEYDGSGAPERGVPVPSPALADLLRLRPEGPRSFDFVDERGDLAFANARRSDGEGAVMIAADRLAPALAEQDLITAWMFWCEKDGGKGRLYDSHEPEGWESHCACGLYWAADGAIEGERWIV